MKTTWTASRLLRIYVTCMDPGCQELEIYDGGTVRHGRKAARDHVAATGHDVCVDEERTFFVSPERRTT